MGHFVDVIRGVAMRKILGMFNIYLPTKNPPLKESLDKAVAMKIWVQIRP